MCAQGGQCAEAFAAHGGCGDGGRVDAAVQPREGRLPGLLGAPGQVLADRLARRQRARRPSPHRQAARRLHCRRHCLRAHGSLCWRQLKFSPALCPYGWPVSALQSSHPLTAVCLQFAVVGCEGWPSGALQGSQHSDSSLPAIRVGSQGWGMHWPARAVVPWDVYTGCIRWCSCTVPQTGVLLICGG